MPLVRFAPPIPMPRSSSSPITTVKDSDTWPSLREPVATWSKRTFPRSGKSSASYSRHHLEDTKHPGRLPCRQGPGLIQKESAHEDQRYKQKALQSSSTSLGFRALHPT